MNKEDLKTSLILNFIILLFTVFASVVMFTGYRFMHGYEIILESTRLGMFKFFTIQSNLLAGISSLLFAINEIQVLKGTKEDISFRNYVLKLMATSAVGLTFFVVFTYLGPIAKGGISALLMNSNLFFHLIIPCLSILNFIMFEKTDKLKYKHTFFGIIPTLIYGIYYMSNIIIHAENGKVSPIYDWYWFVQQGIWSTVIVVPVIFLISYLIGLFIWKCNKYHAKKIK